MSFEDRGKRVTWAQQTGDIGEKFFDYWSSMHRLSATKVGRDIGIDYLCQVLQPVDGSKSLEGSGAVVGVQVKSVNLGENARLTLERTDAVDLLRQTQATCLIGVQLDTQMVRFRFLDANFVDELWAFLEGSHKSWSCSFSVLSSDLPFFYSELERVANSFFQQRLRIHQAQKRLRSAIPGASVFVNSTPDSTTSRIDVPRVHDAYVVDDGVADKVRIEVFERGYIDPSQEGVSLRPEIDRIVHETQSSALILVGAIGSTTSLTIRCGKETRTSDFEVRDYKDEVSLVHAAGLRLTVSAARSDAKGYVHQLEHDFFEPETPFTWDHETFGFFELFQDGAELQFPDGRVWAIKMFGESLTLLGRAIKVYWNICEALEIENTFAFVDLKDQELTYTLGYLDQLFFEGAEAESFVQGFVLGPGAELPPDALDTENVRIRLPIAANWKQHGIVTWIDAEASAFIYQNQMCGFRLTKQVNWSVEKRERFEKSIHPEAWFFPDWPALPIGSLQVGTTNFTHGDKRLPLGAVVKQLGSNEDDET